jgi:hypothetical protein
MILFLNLLHFPLVSLISFWVGPPDWLRKEQQNQSSTLTLVRHENVLPSPYYVHFFWNSVVGEVKNGYGSDIQIAEESSITLPVYFVRITCLI